MSEKVSGAERHEEKSQDRNKKSGYELLRAISLSHILGKIEEEDPDYYKRILTIFRVQTFIDLPRNSIPDHESLAARIIHNSDLFKSYNYFDYSFRQFGNRMATIITPIPVEIANGMFSDNSFSRILKDSLSKNLIFKAKFDSVECYVLPVEYRFMDKTIFGLSIEFSLEKILKGKGKSELENFLGRMETHLPKNSSGIVVKSAAYSYIINGFEDMLSKTSEEKRSLFNFIMNSNGIASIDEIQDTAGRLLYKNGAKDGNNGGKSKANTPEIARLIESLERDFLISLVKDSYSGESVAYSIPAELAAMYSTSMLSSVKKISKGLVPNAGNNQSSILEKIINFMLASYYLEVHGFRRTTEKLTAALSIDQVNLALIDKLCRQFGYISGSNSTYNITKVGIKAFQNPERIRDDIKNYMPSLSKTPNWSFSGENGQVLEVAIRIYRILMSDRVAYSTKDINTMVKWDPENMNEFSRRFLYSISLRSVRYRNEDNQSDPRKLIFDPSNGSNVAAAIKYLAELGVILTGHAGESHDEVVMASEYFELTRNDKSKEKNYEKFIDSSKHGMILQSNYEIIVSPFEKFDTLRTLIYGCELVSASTRVIFRITDKNLRFYNNNIGDLKEFTSVIEKRSVHGIPENVARTINDIAAHSGEITVRNCAGILVFKDSILMKMAETKRSFSKIDTFRITDNVMGIVNSEDFVKIGKVLDNTGFLYKIHREKDAMGRPETNGKRNKTSGGDPEWDDLE